MLTKLKGINVDLTAFMPFDIIIHYAGFIHTSNDTFSYILIKRNFVSLFSS